MKTIAFYLPQYHAIPENDKWWGEGFTEWDNVKKAKPLFKGHNQPEIPINNDYYCLLDEGVHEKQSKLALEYGVDAFCYYHYWFDGKLLLEKPLEKMLKNPRVEIPFCLCWANESWSRNWDGKETKILIKQNYDDGIEGWRKHYDYLSKYFKDDRYIKEDNKPVVIIYKPQLINDLKAMLFYWSECAVTDGFDGIYYGYQYPTAFKETDVVDAFDFGIEFEPIYTYFEIEREYAYLDKRGLYMYGLKHPRWLANIMANRLKGLPMIYDYDEVWERILRRKPINEKVVAGAFTSWDNTPRRGVNGVVYSGATPTKFEDYIKTQYERSKRLYNDKFLFINAWNEWGEGAHLEGDEYFKYGYLEALRRAKMS